MLPGRIDVRCDWPKAAIDRRGVSTRSGPKRLICEILTLSEHDIAIGCDIANHLPCTAPTPGGVPWCWCQCMAKL